MASSINASTSGAGGVITTADNTGILNLQTAGTTAVTVDASQNVGIGTTSPTNGKLVITGSAVTTAQGIRLTGDTADARFICESATLGAGILGTFSNHSQLFYTNSTERMRIDSSGNVFVNTTSQIDQGLICAAYNGQAKQGIVLKDTNATLNGSYMYFINSAGSLAGQIQHNGTTTVSYVTSSDYRLKENIAPMTGALDKIAQLKPVTYTWKNTNGEQGEGFIAHELAEVCPLAVSGKKDDVNEDGSIKAQGIDTSFLVATLTAAIQEQQTIINDLKARIETLEAK